MPDEAKMTEAEVATLLAHAELPPAAARRAHLAAGLPGFRQRCARLYAIDVAGVEFDFLRPLR
ncbi:MAG: hypothetical protein FJX68_06015 [Alphaproteobacteria bacterium]|nr:hypothetical protein [Alphaproteobacteria bacterium]